MIGDQKANFDIFFSPPAFLHLGRIPESVGTEEVSRIDGFVGCMSNLKVTITYSRRYTLLFSLFYRFRIEV